MCEVSLMPKHISPDHPDFFTVPETGPDFSLETLAQKRGLWPVAGTDEAGRGPLAGPVVAAAVILDGNAIPVGLNDSKKLTARRREALYEEILATATVSIASSGANHIDRRDIRKASLDAMRRAVAGLTLVPAHVLCDGRDVPPGLICSGSAVIKGDARSLSIAAASIIAKVMRDRMMERAAKIYPAYGFDAHAGYGTKTHLQAIVDNGPCILHRMSFRPLRQE
ncbi:ribonuclease HII [Allorhizobium terrae]|uniref:Ribonuclease HII n=1 Tax=Allorhizobium terrae TaxID=1848972 RepID=A0A4S3ZYC2_9HYPH|nr:ribonuclease HII [Allorhizobium terrae]